ncbi:translation initiation factor, aIF-2BI family [Methanohalobium evestigatum Z-7303]|uniref:Putative methylthioribose-1-phosphate isomerase n=1 Tax=Methanohalobium evestigatum (strain ATCC BAA-1072 / DSM 3721 / NBRC 107634 / OCM 161 / Z-7303) TaxID=644295 RepID=D7E603_METEZ|nr:S-methyl-5-thioribose-1-phosphate isomerase [Methanohalobium evestigatum]ADI73025.1 translation initiation factor, aIF-2BI family [Methanohalobium evestigatum Z-7303]
MRTIDWNDESNTIKLIDQTLLPSEYKVIECKTIESLCESIKSLRIRGAPALGAAGGYGIALAAVLSKTDNMDNLTKDLQSAAETIKATRPTAVNLAWGVERVIKATSDAYDFEGMKNIAIEEAKQIADEDVAINKKIGEHGSKLLEDGDTVLTHCNAGKLACVDWGTALGVIRSAIESGKNIKVVACETRPLNQGSRLTTWELMQDNIPVTLISDSMAGHVIRHEAIDKVIVGADRITEDAVFNKIGTYTHSVLAKEHEIPFYVAAPTSTFDFKGWEGSVKIEQRNADELRYFGNVQIAPENVNVYNPAFDATPMENISAIITENGVFHPPFLLDEVLI